MSYVSVEQSVKFSQDLYNEATEYYNSLLKDQPHKKVKIESNSAGHVVTSTFMVELEKLKE